nr:hypothetical protein CFP56_70410 [Quercus suber]
MASDIASVGMQNPYHQAYAYAPSPHDQSAFAFPGQPHQYRPQLQTQQLPLPSHHHQHQHPSLAQQSPNARKRRVSDLNESMPGSLPGSASSNASAYGLPQTLVPGPSELDVGLGPSQGPSQIPSPVAKKGRTNTPWTPAEEQRLKALRDAGSSWSEIAKTFPTRTEGHALCRVRGRRSEQFRSPPISRRLGSRADQCHRVQRCCKPSRTTRTISGKSSARRLGNQQRRASSSRRNRVGRCRSVADTMIRSGVGETFHFPMASPCTWLSDTHLLCNAGAFLQCFCGEDSCDGIVAYAGLGVSRGMSQSWTFAQTSGRCLWR